MPTVFSGSHQGPFFLALGETGQKVPVTLTDASGNLVTGVTAPTVQISKNGAAYANLSDGTFAEIGNGDYTVSLGEADVGSVGWAILRVIKAASTTEAKVNLVIGISPQQWRNDLVRTRTLHRQGK
jgi:hypothetical protein